jgi:hypothetical protein
VLAARCCPILLDAARRVNDNTSDPPGPDDHFASAVSAPCAPDASISLRALSVPTPLPLHAESRGEYTVCSFLQCCPASPTPPWAGAAHWHQRRPLAHWQPSVALRPPRPRPLGTDPALGPLSERCRGNGARRPRPSRRGTLFPAQPLDAMGGGEWVWPPLRGESRPWSIASTVFLFPRARSGPFSFPAFPTAASGDGDLSG